MKLEKRGDFTPEEPASTPSAGAEKKSKKPVIIYIMIMFIVAFLLMALSFFMHQRTNTEALGELQESVTTIQQVQADQEKIIALQEELSEAQEQLETQAADAESAGKVTEALLHLYYLELHYDLQQFDACKADLREMEEEGLVDFLPENDKADLPAPAQRYQPLKEAVAAK